MTDTHIFFRYLFCLLLPGCCIPAFGQGQPAPAARKPFPQHVQYAAGTIRPSRISQREQDQLTLDFYKEWRAHFTDELSDSLCRIICKPNEPGEYTVSEGQGYGMLIAVLMADQDRDAQPFFNRLYRFYRAHRCTRNGTHLMNWAVRKNGRNKGNDSAADGDLDIAYALLLADRQWGKGMIDYAAEARAVIADIAQWTVNPVAHTMLLSNMSGENEYPITRASDFMPAYFREFAREVPGTALDDAAQKGYTLLRRVQTAPGNTTALLPDFIVGVGTAPRAAAPRQIRDEKIDCSAYNYNACRVPWRVGVDLLTCGDTSARNLLSGMNTFIRQAAHGQPKLIGAGYHPENGKVVDPDDTLHLCYAAPFAVAAMAGGDNRDWLDDCWDYINSVKISAYTDPKDNGYYDSTIKLLCLIVLSGNYWPAAH